jgi:hypothetical protein
MVAALDFVPGVAPGGVVAVVDGAGDGPAMIGRAQASPAAVRPPSFRKSRRRKKKSGGDAGDGLRFMETTTTRCGEIRKA